MMKNLDYIARYKIHNLSNFFFEQIRFYMPKWPNRFDLTSSRGIREFKNSMVGLTFCD